MATNTNITGVAELDAKLFRLSRALRKKIVNSAARKGLKPVLKQARKNAPVKTGALRRGTKIKTTRSRVRSGARIETNRRQFYGTILEFEHSHKSGANIPGMFWMERALEDKREAGMRIFRTEIINGIEKWAPNG